MRTRTRTLAAASSLAALSLLLVACGSSDDSADAAPGSSSAAAGGLDADGCVSDYQEGTDYFPDKLTVEDATGFTLDYHENYVVVDVAQTSQGGPSASYVLVKCGTPAPELTGDLADATAIDVPVHSIYSDSTTHLPSIVEIGALDDLTGVNNASYVSNADVLAKAAAGDLVSYAESGSIDVETVIAGDPGVFVTAGYEAPEYAQIAAAGIPVVADTEYLEPTPLGRAEWVKLFAALTGKESAATDLYAGIKSAYQDLVAQTGAAQPVLVFSGSVYQGQWSVPGGQSFKTTLVHDAGGITPWDDDASTGSLQLDFESVLAKGQGADVLLLEQVGAATKADLTALEPRLADFKAFDGNVWNVKPSTPGGFSYDLYELGYLHPELVLGDMAAMFHPELFPGHEFTFYAAAE